ncbi:MAG: protein-export chaperone SecB [Parvularcula sp.]|jgi:preprotein translocase subunit SecB|nr:protein-export chaperone SecB [Parvularcula sp.]
MSDTPAQDPQNAAEAMPSMRVLMQYLKDLSFENPGAPQTLGAAQAQPSMEVGVDVNARGLGQNRYEVELSCSATAKRDDNVVYVAEVNYAGLFEIHNVPQDRLEMVLLIDAPYLLFPFVRQIVAQSTRDGGFVPLLLEPLDFAGMYQQQRAARGDQGVPSAAPSELT